MATEAQIAANRLNGLKGGVKTEEGKAISRLNALKHGIFATALMERGSDGFFSALLDELNAELKPVGIVEQLLVDKLAVTYLRMRRCAQAETLHFQQRWNFNPANFGKFPYDEAVVAIGLYDARLTTQFLRLLHEIEQRQKIRRSEECRTQIAGRRTTAHGKLQPEESAAKVEREEEVKNEPNLAQEIAQTEGWGQSEGDERTANNSRNESRDESRATRMKNEPNSAGVAQPPPAVLSSLDSRPPRQVNFRGNDVSQAGAPVPQETKNEPNLSHLALATCVSPGALSRENLAKVSTNLRKVDSKVGSAEAQMETKNEPNLCCALK